MRLSLRQQGGLLLLSSIVSALVPPANANEAEQLALEIALYNMRIPAPHVPKRPDCEVLPKREKKINWQSKGFALTHGGNSLVYFDGGPTCSLCKVVKDKCFTNDRVIDAMNQYVTVQMDKDDAEQFGITQFPMLMIMSPSGENVGMFVCPTDPDELVDLLTPDQGE